MSRRLYRSTENKMIGGVCAGMGDYFEIDPVIVRIAAVVLCFADGIGLLAYIIAWIVVPAAPPGHVSNKVNKSEASKNWKKYFPGLLLIAAGSYLLADQYFYWFDIGDMWPILLIVVGVGVIMMSMRRDGRDAAEKMESETHHTNNEGSMA